VTGGSSADGGAATQTSATGQKKSSSLLKVLLLLLLVGLVGGGLWFQVALDETERALWLGRARQQYRLLNPLWLTPAELAKYDASDPSLPIYLGIRGEIYDVSSGPGYYGKNGGYAGFSGKDATKAYFDLCFTEECLKNAHCTNLLSEAQLKELDGWVEFYRNEPKYPFVGYVKYDGNPPSECVAAEKALALAKMEETMKAAVAAAPKTNVAAEEALALAKMEEIMKAAVAAAAKKTD
jgi:predicted heme/steroid binding protein